MIRITETDTLCRQVYGLYDKSVKAGEILHQELSFEEFCEKIFTEQEEIRKITVAEEEGKAFASGCIDRRLGKAFVTFVAVEKSERRKGMGKAVLEELERVLKEEGNQEAVELSFFNPSVFTWRIPGKKGVTHPNTPGIDVDSAAYPFFKNCGYQEFAIQNSYYLPLALYGYPADMAERKAVLKQKGYTFTVYDKEKHIGMEEMLKDLNNLNWMRDILGEPSLSQGGRPILVPVCGDKVCGFTGPLETEKSGRGFFAGIAVASSERGNGLAKVLFCELCFRLKSMGAEYMTLFTGENNPARNIYEAAGFSVVKTWADMRKNLVIH